MVNQGKPIPRKSVRGYLYLLAHQTAISEFAKILNNRENLLAKEKKMDLCHSFCNE